MTNPEKYKNIFGWFNFEAVYDMIYNSIVNNGTFIEVGVFEGKSLCYMAELNQIYGKNLSIIGVDHFRGSDEPLHHLMLANSQITLADKAYQNLQNAQVLRDIVLLPFASEEAKDLFNDNSVDAIFIDASHDYENVKADILHWLPKVKDGGILAGHDYYGNHKEVKLAVDDSLHNYEIFSSVQTECWWIYKTPKNQTSASVVKRSCCN